MASFPSPLAPSGSSSLSTERVTGKRKERDPDSPSTDLKSPSSTSSASPFSALGHEIVRLASRGGTHSTSSVSSSSSLPLSLPPADLERSKIPTTKKARKKRSSTEPEGFNAQEKEAYKIFRTWMGKSPKKGAPKVFEPQYRRLQQGHDEAVSTASVRDLVRGIRSELKTYKGDKEKLMDAIARQLVRVSGARLPTRFVGRATADPSDLMQHPTGGEGGTFAAMETPSHIILNVQRLDYVVQETQAALNRDGATIESVFRAMIRAAGEFTLNVMVAPARASTVAPHTFNTDTDAQREQTEAREEFKRYIELWGDAEPGGGALTQLDTAPWRPGGRDARTSPARRASASSSLFSSSSSSLSSSSSSSGSSLSSSSSSSSSPRRRPTARMRALSRQQASASSSSSSSLLSPSSVSLDLTSPPLARNSDLKSTSMPDIIP